MTDDNDRLTSAEAVALAAAGANSTTAGPATAATAAGPVAADLIDDTGRDPDAAEADREPDQVWGADLRQ